MVYRIAVIKDDATPLDLLKEIFAEQRWELLAPTGIEDLSALEQENPDLVLMDLWLEGGRSG